MITFFALLVFLLSTLSGCARYQPYGNHNLNTAPIRYDLVATKPGDEQLIAMHLGNTNVFVSDGEHHLLVDGFFTRPGGWFRILFGTIQSDADAIQKGLEMAGIDDLPLDAVLVGHSHYDHALDAPLVTMRNPKTLLYGSESTRLIAKSHPGFDDSRFRDMSREPVVKMGRFTITFIPSAHAKLGPDWLSKTTAGTITATPRIPSHATTYKDGGVYVIHIAHPQGNVLVHTSTGYIDGHLEGFLADTVFLSLAGMDHVQGSETEEQRIRNVLWEIAGRVRAKRIIPVHWDDFTRPIDKPLVPLPSSLTDIGKIVAVIEDELRSRSEWQDTKLLWLPVFVALNLNSSDLKPSDSSTGYGSP